VQGPCGRLISSDAAVEPATAGPSAFKAERFGCQLMYLCTQERAAASDFILDDGAVHPQKGYSTFVLTSDRCDVGW